MKEDLKLSKKALELLQALFAENSNLNLPVGVAKEIVEIKEWVKEELKNNEGQNT